jgi:hypothetical protein
MHITQMRLVGPCQHAAREGGRGGDHGIETGDVELLHEKRTEKEERTIVVLDQWQTIGRRGVKGDVAEILLLDLGWEKVEEREDLGSREKLADPGKNALAAAKIGTPVVYDRDPCMAVEMR